MAGIFRRLLAEDRLVRVFSVGRLPHPVLIEMVGLAGSDDGIWLDQEHGGLTTEQITMARLTTQAVGLGCFVRLATPHYSLVNQALESGVDGVSSPSGAGVYGQQLWNYYCRSYPANVARHHRR